MPTQLSQAVAERKTVPQPVTLLRSNEAKFAEVLPQHIPVGPFLGLAAGALYRDEKLMAAAANSPADWYTALLKCASLGHQPGSDEFYLTIRSKKVAGRYVDTVQGIEGYRGIIERMYRSGAVASVIVREVRERDGFEFVEGVHERPVHRVDWFNQQSDDRGKLIGVYAYAQLTTGAVSRVVILSEADVMRSRDASDGALKKDGSPNPYSPWNAPDGGLSMWLKTAARRLEPWVPTSAEYRRQLLAAAGEIAGDPGTAAALQVDTERAAPPPVAPAGPVRVEQVGAPVVHEGRVVDTDTGVVEEETEAEMVARLEAEEAAAYDSR